MQETYRNDALKELAAANREIAAETRAQRKEMEAWRAEVRADTTAVIDALGGAAQWCGVGLVVGILIAALIGKFGATQK